MHDSVKPVLITEGGGAGERKTPPTISLFEDSTLKKNNYK